MRKTLTALLAALVLVAGAFVATAIVGGAATAQEDQSTDQERPDVPNRGEIVEDVLGDFVADGTLSQAEADAIAAALVARAEEVREEIRQWHEENPGSGRFGRGFKRGFHLGGLLEDGVIDSDELAELPDDHPLKDPDGPAAEYLDDGQLTTDELHELRQELHEQRKAEREARTEGTSS